MADLIQNKPGRKIYFLGHIGHAFSKRNVYVNKDPWGQLWEPYVDTAIGAWNRGDRSRAEKIISLLLQVLKQGQKYNSVDENLVNGLYSVADNFCASREYARAEWIYLKVLESQEDILGQDDPQALNTLMRLSNVVRTFETAPARASSDDALP